MLALVVMQLRFLPGMRWALVLLMMAGGLACSGKKKSQQDPQSYADGTAEAAFISMHKSFRAVDGEASWALFSTEMKTGMARRLKSLREQPERLKADIGSLPADLSTASDAQLYQLLLSGKRMQQKLTRGFPVVTGGAEIEPGLREVRYTDARRGACAQRFIKQEGAWKAQRGPTCPGSKK